LIQISAKCLGRTRKGGGGVKKKGGKDKGEKKKKGLLLVAGLKFTWGWWRRQRRGERPRNGTTVGSRGLAAHAPAGPS